MSAKTTTRSPAVPIAPQRASLSLGLLLAVSACGPPPPVQLPPRGDTAIMAQPSPEPAPPPPEAPAPAPEPTTCGELILEEIGMEAAGAGPGHPRLAGLRAARKVACAEGDETETLRLACADVRQSLEASGYGPQHPEMRVFNAKLARCDAVPPPPPAGPPTPEECRALRVTRARESAEGKGDAHPIIVALDQRLAQCPREGM